MLSLGSALVWIGQALHDAGLDNSSLDAELLLAHVIGKPRTYALAYPEALLPQALHNRLSELIERRTGGTPLAYLLGSKEFWSLRLWVNQHTLIPRPETELLVQLALDRLSSMGAITVADLGTGSGAIALALARDRPAWRITATDLCVDALLVARENASRLMIDIELLRGDWCQPLVGRQFHLILSNPPYIRADDPCLRDDGLVKEPRLALASGADGLDAIRSIAEQAMDYLLADGMLLLEHGQDQAPAVHDLLQSLGWTDIEQHLDLAGKARATLAHRPSGNAHG